MISSNIKNLAIACEALSRINGMDNELSRVQDLLRDALTRAETEKPYTPAYTQSSRTTTLNEEIPF